MESFRANHNLYEFSDRDIVRFEAPLGDKTAWYKAMNQKLLETCYNFKPDFILLGHCDLVTASTLTEVREAFTSG